MFKKSVALIAVSTVIFSSAALASDDGDDGKENGIRDGATVYEQSCAVCHSNNSIKSALQFGNRDDWEELIEEGQQFPVAHGWVGTRQMPRKGGDPEITLDEFINAVAYIGNSVGAGWKDAENMDEEMYKEILKEIKIRYQRNELYDKIGKKY
jgi:cytochrome c5